MIKNIFIFGFGYCAEFWAQSLANQGYEIVGTSRNKLFREKFNQQKQSKIKLIDFNQDIESYLKKADAILVSIAPNQTDGDLVFKQFSTHIIQNQERIKWLGYLSSTGVYGNHNGNWVDETSDLNGASKRAIRRKKAEQDWLGLYKNHNLPVHIFRLSGIYGPARNSLIKIKLGKKESVYKPHHYFSRIHLHDIARFLSVSIERPKLAAGEIFNLSDDEPTPLYEVEAYAAELLNLAKLKLVSVEKMVLSEMARELYQNNRKISNQKIKKIYNQNMKFPSYRQGLRFELAQL